MLPWPCNYNACQYKMPKLKKNVTPTKISLGHLQLVSKRLAKFHKPNSNGPLDTYWPKFEKRHFSTMKTLIEKKKTNWPQASIHSNVNQVIYFSLTIYSLGFKAQVAIVFEILCWQDFIHTFSQDQNSGKAHNWQEKKLFFHEESIYEISKLACTVQNLCYYMRMHKKVCNVKMLKMTKDHNKRSTFQNLFKC